MWRNVSFQINGPISMDNWKSEEMFNENSSERHRKKPTADSSFYLEIDKESTTPMESAINGPVNTTLTLVDVTVLQTLFEKSATVQATAAKSEATAGLIKQKTIRIEGIPALLQF